jgi:hypothetical protein
MGFATHMRWGIVSGTQVLPALPQCKWREEWVSLNTFIHKSKKKRN